MMNRDYRWSDSELEKIADRIRYKLTGGKAVTVDGYVGLARRAKKDDIGRINLWILAHEPRIGRHIPREVIKVLSEKIGYENFYGGEEAHSFVRLNHTKGSKWLASRLYISRGAARSRVRRLGLTTKRLDYRHYSKEEIKILTNADLYRGVDRELAEKCHRSLGAISIKRRRLGLKIMKSRFVWSKHPEALDYLRANYKTMTYRQIAEHLGLEEKKVVCKAEREGLRKHRSPYNDISKII
jgi:hypothetical protein